MIRNQMSTLIADKYWKNRLFIPYEGGERRARNHERRPDSRDLAAQLVPPTGCAVRPSPGPHTLAGPGTGTAVCDLKIARPFPTAKLISQTLHARPVTASQTGVPIVIVIHAPTINVEVRHP